MPPTPNPTPRMVVALYGKYKTWRPVQRGLGPYAAAMLVDDALHRSPSLRRSPQNLPNGADR